MADVVPWDGRAAPVLVHTEPTAGQHLVVGRLDNGLFVLDDTSADRRLGPVDLLSLFAVPSAGQDGILLVGVDERAVSVTIEWDDGREERQVQNGVWMTVPRPFVPGARITVRWHHPDGEPRFTTIGPLQAGDLIPNRPAWTGYADA